jgi:hypothetical protein
MSFSLNSVQHPENTAGNIAKLELSVSLRSLLELINWFE